MNVSCLSGMMVVKHPNLDILCRDDGAVLLPSSGPHRKKGEWTYGCKTKKGYRVVGYNKKQYFVHNLILEAFKFKASEDLTCDHINRLRDDNRLVNLRWADWKTQCDNRQSVIDAPDYGVRKCEDSAAYRRARYDQCPEVRERHKAESRAYYHKKVAEGWKQTRHGWEKVNNGN